MSEGLSLRTATPAFPHAYLYARLGLVRLRLRLPARPWATA
jgi:hypothetical protein